LLCLSQSGKSRSQLLRDGLWESDKVIHRVHIESVEGKAYAEGVSSVRDTGCALYLTAGGEPHIEVVRRTRYKTAALGRPKPLRQIRQRRRLLKRKRLLM